MGSIFSIESMMKWTSATWCIVILIALISLVAFILLMYFGWKFHKQSDSLLDELKKLGDKPLQTQEDFERLYCLHIALEKNSVGQMWHRYKKTIIAPQYLEARNEQEGNSIAGSATVGFIQKPIFSMDSSWNYFNVENLWNKQTLERFFQYIPALMVGLGILGTFLGLSRGVSQAVNGINSVNILEMRASMSNLLQGASTAFVTSLVGLFASIVFGCVSRYYHQKVQAKIYALNERIEILIPYVSYEYMLFLSQKTRAESKELIAGMGRVIRGELTTVMDKLREDNKEQNERLVLALRKIRGVFQNLSTNQVEQIGTLIEKAVESMSTIFGEELKKMTDSFATAAQSITNSADAVKSIMHRLERSVSNVSQDLQNKTQQTTKSLEQAVEHTTQVIDQSVTTLEEKLSNVNASMAIVLTKSQEMQTSIVNTASRVEASVVQARRTFILVMTEGSKIWTRQMLAVPEKANELMTESINRSTQALSIAWANASKRATTNFTESLTKAGNDFAQTCIRPLKHLIVTIEPLVQEIKGHSDASKTLMTAMQQLLRTFQDMDGNMGESLQQLIRAMQENQTSMRAITALMNEFGQSVNNLLIIQGNMKNSIQLIQESHSNVADLLNTLHDVTKGQLDTIAEVLDQQNQSIRKNMIVMDKNLSSALQQMSATLKSWIRQQNQVNKSYKRTMDKMKQTIDVVGKKMDRIS